MHLKPFSGKKDGRGKTGFYNYCIKILPNYLDWQFDEAVLVQEVNGTVIRTRNAGLLIVNFANEQRGEKMNATVCPGNFNWYSAKTYCRYFGFGNEQGMWDSRPNNLTLISE